MRDIQGALHLRLEVRGFFRRRRMLEIVERPPVGNGRYHGAQLQRSHGDSLAEGAHAADAALACRNSLIRVGAQLFAGDVPPRKLA